MTREDGGYFVERTMVMRAAKGEGPAAVRREAMCICYFSSLAVEARPVLPYEVANRLNRSAGLPEVAVPPGVQRRMRIGL